MQECAENMEEYAKMCKNGQKMCKNVQTCARMCKECAKMCKNVQKMCKNVQKMCKNAQKCARMYRNVQKCAKICKECVRMCKNVQECARMCKCEMPLDRGCINNRFIPFLSFGDKLPHSKHHELRVQTPRLLHVQQNLRMKIYIKRTLRKCARWSAINIWQRKQWNGVQSSSWTGSQTYQNST